MCDAAKVTRQGEERANPEPWPPPWRQPRGPIHPSRSHGHLSPEPCSAPDPHTHLDIWIKSAASRQPVSFICFFFQLQKSSKIGFGVAALRVSNKQTKQIPHLTKLNVFKKLSPLIQASPFIVKDGQGEGIHTFRSSLVGLFITHIHHDLHRKSDFRR